MQTFWRVVFLALLMVFFAFPVYSQVTDSSLTYQEFPDIDIPSLIIDETMTKIGKDFFDLFFTNWQEPFGINEYQITISEKALPRLGTLISVNVNDLQAYRRFLKPRYEEIETAAREAVRMVQQVLINYDKIQKDLAGEDLKGTGIY